MGPGSPPFDSPSAVERGPRVRVPAFWALLSPGPTLPGLGLDPSLWVSGLLSCVSHFLSLVPHRGSWVRPPTHYPPPAATPMSCTQVNTGGPACPGSPEHTARKSRWSLLYCHRLAKRLEAAREDFSLSGLAGSSSQQSDRLGHGEGCWGEGLTCPASS